MNVGQLRAFLEGVEDEMLVVMSSDTEGNSYSPLIETYFGTYEPETSYSGHLVEVDADWAEDIEEDVVIPEDAVNCVVFYPAN